MDERKEFEQENELDPSLDMAKEEIKATEAEVEAEAIAEVEATKAEIEATEVGIEAEVIAEVEATEAEIEAEVIAEVEATKAEIKATEAGIGYQAQTWETEGYATRAEGNAAQGTGEYQPPRQPEVAEYSLNKQQFNVPFNTYGGPVPGFTQPPKPNHTKPHSADPILPGEAQWSFHDYEPLNSEITDTPKKPKKGFGIKVYAVIMSVLFLLSAGGFVLTLVWDDFNAPLIENDVDVPDENGSANFPTLDIRDTPNSGDLISSPNGALEPKDIYTKVAPSVVGIAVYTNVQGKTLLGQGSGIIMTADGYIITNAHVVTSSSYEISDIEVILPDDEATVIEATLVGADTSSDLAVLKISGNNYPFAEFGDSDKLSIGDPVYVIGNPSGLEFSGSFTHGMVSALNRNVYMNQLKSEIEYIQTDAPINSGNSGGAFINQFGQIVGISSAKMRVDLGYEGMGFAIPINNAQGIVNSLIENGYVAGRPLIGIEYVVIADSVYQFGGIPRGLRVHTVNPNSDAYAKGVLPGDIITHLDGEEVYDAESLSKVMGKKSAGENIVITVYRFDEDGDGFSLDIDVTLMENTSN